MTAADTQPGESGKPWRSGTGWALWLQWGDPDCGTRLNVRQKKSVDC